MLQAAGPQDLIVIRTRHVGYRLAELSRIENIAPGELRDRRHKVETETSTTFFEEVENEEETTESLATTTRDELHTEITTMSARQLALKGVVRSSYRGPVAVEVEASAEFGQQAQVHTSTTTTHAVDVVDEASTRARERVLRRNEHRFRRLISETNRHKFENESAIGRVAQYYWLEKVQRVALFNYGRRLMYEFVVPEPASYLRELGAQAPAVPSPVPAPPTEYYASILAMTLDQLEDEYTSARLAASFTVAVGERPAATWIDTEISHEVADAGDEKFTTAGAELVVPAGYEGVHVRITVQAGAEDKDIWTHLTLSLADLALHLQGRTIDDDMNFARFGWRGEPAQDIGDPGDLRVYIADAPIPDGRPPLVEGTYKTRIFVENFNVYTLTAGMLVSPTEATVDTYRRSILAAVVTDYRRQYETFTAQALAATPSGPTLLENLSDAQSAELRTIEHDEVKRAALAVIRNADPVGADPIQGENAAVAGWFRDNRALADEILFLEQAFEWEHMNVVLYGYHWSDPEERALQVFGVRGGDRPFREFLKAGAARVQLPVRPGFAGFVDDYMMSGTVWSGGPRPQIGSPGYVDFVTEQSIQLGAPANEVPQAEDIGNGQHRPVFWDVVTPTDLVLLKAWDDGAEPPLERMIPPDHDALTVPADNPCTDPLSGWESGTGPVPDDPSA